MTTQTKPAGNRPILLVCLAVFGLMTGQQMVNPILAPLARELHFSELMLGFVMFIGASGVVLASPFWGRRAAVIGHRPVLLISLVGAVVGLLTFAVVAQIGLHGLLAVPLLYTLVLFSRGVVFGLAWAATPATAQSYVVDVTDGEAARVKGMSLLGAAQGLGLAVGPALGGLLSIFGLVVPMYVAPAVIGSIAILVLVLLPKPAHHVERPPAAKVSPFDRRMWPFLTTGFGLYLAITIVLMTVGFLLQDRLHVSVQHAGQATGFVTLAGAGLLVIVQGAAVPKLGWTPLRLIRVGAVIMTAGMVVTTVADNEVLLGVGVGLLGAGLGLGMPGIMSAPTLLATREEQGAVAGLVSSSSALTFAIGPLIGNGLYEIAPVVPYIAGSVLMVLLVAFVFTHPGMRQVIRPASASAPAKADEPLNA